MVGSYNEAKESDWQYGSDYSYVSEWFFFSCIVCYYVGNYSETWEDEDVNFGVTEESE